MYVHCNVESEKDLKNAIDTCVKKYGKIDCLFNNAGFVGDSSSIEDMNKNIFFYFLCIGVRRIASIHSCLIIPI